MFLSHTKSCFPSKTKSNIVYLQILTYETGEKQHRSMQRLKVLNNFLSRERLSAVSGTFEKKMNAFFIKANKKV